MLGNVAIFTVSFKPTRSLKKVFFFIRSLYTKPQNKGLKLIFPRPIGSNICENISMVFLEFIQTLLKISVYQFSGLPNCQVTKFLVTKFLVTKFLVIKRVVSKFSGNQIVELLNC